MAQIDLDLHRTFPEHAGFRVRSAACATAPRTTEQAATLSHSVVEPSHSAAAAAPAQADGTGVQEGSLLRPLRSILVTVAHTEPSVGYQQARLPPFLRPSRLSLFPLQATSSCARY